MFSTFAKCLMLLQDLTNKNRWGEIFILSIFEDNLQLLRDSFNYYFFFFTISHSHKMILLLKEFIAE